MKISSIRVDNFQIITELMIEPTAPILLIAGNMEQGKSSLHDAIRMALTGESLRVKLKKDYDALVRDGAKKGAISVAFADGRHADIALPSGKQTQGGSSDIQLDGDTVQRHSAALPYLIDPAKFAAADENVRRAFLFGLAGITCDTASVKKRLLKRGCDAKKVELTATMLRAGFAPAHDAAKDKAKEARGAWKGVTGETYGERKAEDWKLEAAPVDAEAIAKATTERDEAMLKADAAIAEFTRLESQKTTAARRASRIAELRPVAERKERIEAKLQNDRKELAEWQTKVDDTRAKAGGQRPAPLACPHCAGLLSSVHGVLVAYEEPEHAHDAEAAAKLPEYEKAHALLQSAVANGERDLQQANDAIAQIAELSKNQPPSESDFTAAVSAAEAARTERTQAQERLTALNAAARAAADAKDKTEKAKQHHDDATQWEQIADALAPDGIPGELLADALKPLNDRLRDTSISTGWAQVTVDSEMAIRIGGRLYTLMSESAKWRADAAIAEAISHMAGIGFFILDRMDVLDSAGRIACLKWLHGLAQRGEVETVIALGTFKELPKCPPTFDARWIANGAIQELETA